MNTMLFGEFSEMSDIRELGLIAAAAPEQIEAMIARLFGEDTAGTATDPRNDVQPEAALACNLAPSRG
jgi:hypothetical protein